ncbi:hypothetical protein RJ640_013932 [Escallonia rubra]|uniref:RRM domain-containing protein n=1 Tax=Escallonia rubra TaxID=112253 RepID=A0AA88QPN1_9ASTE|nr:hypothetical protein RJ640_013932 [Escallonia rubra]
MALSHLLQTKQIFQLRRTGFPRLSRWYSSASSKGSIEKPKKAGAIKEQKVFGLLFLDYTMLSFSLVETRELNGRDQFRIKIEMLREREDARKKSEMESSLAIDIFSPGFMEMHPGVFPKAKHVQNEVGGSWYTLKAILQKLKERMSEDPSVQNSGETSKSTVSAADFVDITSQSNHPDISELGEVKGTMKNALSDKSDTSPSKENYASHAPSDITGEGSSVKIFNSTTLGVNRSCDSLHFTEYPEAACVVTVSEPVADSHHNKERVPTGNDEGLKVTTSSQNLNLGSEMGEGSPSSNGAEKARAFADRFMKKMNGGLAVKHENEHERLADAIPGILLNVNRGQKLKSEQLSSLKNLIPSEATRTLQDSKNQLTLSMSSSVVSEAVEMPASYANARNDMGSVGTSTRRMRDREVGKMTETNCDIHAPNIFSECSNETTGDVAAKRCDIQGLIDCIKELPGEKWRDGAHKIILERIYTEGKKGDKEPGPKAPFQVSKSNAWTKEGGDLSFAALRNSFCRLTSRVPPETSRKPLNETRDTFSTDEVSGHNKLVMRFLHKSAKESDIHSALKDCGVVEKIELSNISRRSHKTAYVYFKTREGLRKALEMTDLLVQGVIVSMEAVSSLDSISKRIPIPNLIDDPNVPAALVKNPTRTVILKQLTDDISSHDIEKALAFCGSNISAAAKELQTICESLGKVRLLVHRSRKAIDVHFSFNEWPNMGNILNRLNGVVVDGNQLLAQPAPVFPPDVLQVLWNQTHGRMHVKAKVQSLLQQLEENAVQKAGLTELVAEFYGDEL